MKISQREARQNKRELARLQNQIENMQSRWAREWPGGVNIGGTNLAGTPILLGRLQSARMLKHALVATVKDDGDVLFYALPISEVQP